jgi:muramoyltetrapeptide carboxypeptidase
VPRLPVLTRSSRVAVLAPASAPPDPRLYEAGLEALRQRGLTVEAPETIRPLGYLAGPDDVRLEQLNSLLGREDVDAIFCARGGYGILRILPEVDFEAAAAHPKALVGYSDITALQLALLAKAGLPSIAGPMVAPDWSQMDDFSEESFWRVAGGEAPIEVRNPGGLPLGTIREGAAEGRLIGGNLTMITALLGTPYLPDLDGAILFVEEVGEAPYRIDRDLARLQLAGVLDQLSGMIFRAFTDCQPLPDRPTLALREVVSHYAARIAGPVAAGLTFGHLRPKVSLPIGVSARLAAEERRALLTLTEPVAEPVTA